VAKIELPESWAGVVEPLRVLMVDRREANADLATLPDLAAVSARSSRARRYPTWTSNDGGPDVVSLGERLRPGSAP
jgi:hypothetical protein